MDFMCSRGILGSKLAKHGSICSEPENLTIYYWKMSGSFGGCAAVLGGSTVH